MESSKIFRIRLKFSLEDCTENAMYLINFRLIDNDDLEEPFKTKEVTNKKKNGTIRFEKVLMVDYDFSKICPIKINIEKWHRNQYVNILIKEKFHLSLSSIVASKNSIFKTKCRDFTDDCETLIIEADNPNYSSLEKNLENFNFFDYLKAGIQFDSYIIIDFSGGQEHIPDLRNNQFIQVIEGFRETLSEFVKVFKVYGYGASVKNDEINLYNESQHFFNLNMEEMNENSGFTMIVKKYKECLEKINFDKKGYLSPVLEKIKKEILNIYSPEIYNIVFILINNKPNDVDIQKCIDLQIETSYLPISYVVIFIGNKTDEEIKEVKQIFNNKKKLSSQSVERTRYNLSFFTMKNYNYNSEILKNKCLREIPEQIINFYKNDMICPEDVKKKNLDKIRDSYRKFDPTYSLYEIENDCSAPSVIEINATNNKKEEIQINQNVNNNNQKITNFLYNAESKDIKKENNHEKKYNKPESDMIKNRINNSIKKENPFKNKKIGNISNIEQFKQYYIEIKKQNSSNKKDDVNKKEEIHINQNVNNNGQKITNFLFKPESKDIKKENNNEKIYINTTKYEMKDKTNINIKMENPFKNKKEENISNKEPFEQKYKEIKKENSFNKKDYVNETPDPDKEKEIKDNIKMPNPFIEKGYVNETPDPNKEKEVKDNKIIPNPFIPKIKDEEKEENLNVINMDNRQNNINKIHEEENYINEGIEEKEKNFVNIINNEKDNEKKYQNATPCPDEEPKEKKYIPNPFGKENRIIEEKINEEKKYVNVTPGNDDNNNNNNQYMSNPFKKIEKKNEIKIVEDEKEKNEIIIEKDKKEKNEKKIKTSKIGSHFKIKFNKDLSKLSTLSNSGHEKYDYFKD